MIITKQAIANLSIVLEDMRIKQIDLRCTPRTNHPYALIIPADDDGNYRKLILDKVETWHIS